MERKIKIGCIGLGPRGAGMYKMWINNPNVIPCAVCDKDSSKLEEMKNYLEVEKRIEGVKYYTSIEEFLKSDVEAVLVATHIATHCDISIQCMDAGKHVLCEIPNISSFEEAKKLNRAVKTHPELKFMVAENCCYWAFIDSWKKMYDEGMLGQIIYAESDYLHMHDTSHVKYDENGNPILTWRAYLTSINYLTHNLGPLLYIMNDTCDEITGFVPEINPIEDIHPAEPNGVIMVKTKKGALIKIFIGYGVAHRMRHNFRVYGTKGSLEYRRRRGEAGTIAHFENIPNCMEEIIIPVHDGFPGASEEGHGGADPQLMAAFIDCIINDTKPPLDVEFGINIAIPGLIGEESFKNGNKTIKMPDMSEFE